MLDAGARVRLENAENGKRGAERFTIELEVPPPHLGRAGWVDVDYAESLELNKVLAHKFAADLELTSELGSGSALDFRQRQERGDPHSVTEDLHSAIDVLREVDGLHVLRHGSQSQGLANAAHVVQVLLALQLGQPRLSSPWRLLVMLTIFTALVPYAPTPLDEVTDPGRVVFLCRNEQGESHAATALHVACSGELSERVIRTVHAGTRVAVTGSARLVSEVWDVRSDEGSVRLEIEAADVQVLA